MAAVINCFTGHIATPACWKCGGVVATRAAAKVLLAVLLCSRQKRGPAIVSSIARSC
jgi:hypothetical protein